MLYERTENQSSTAEAALLMVVLMSLQHWHPHDVETAVEQ
jgi:hypothetical protein